MNKKSVMLGILIIVVVSLATGCIFYKLLNSKDFSDHFKALGYTISDTEEGVKEADSYLVATKEDVPYKIEYYEFSSEADAKILYVYYTDHIIDYITSDSKNNEITGAIKAKTVAQSDNEYIVISRVKNTLIFINTTNDYQNEVDTLLEDVGY